MPQVFSLVRLLDLFLTSRPLANLLGTLEQALKRQILLLLLRFSCGWALARLRPEREELLVAQVGVFAHLFFEGSRVCLVVHALNNLCPKDSLDGGTIEDELIEQSLQIVLAFKWVLLTQTVLQESEHSVLEGLLYEAELFVNFVP